MDHPTVVPGWLSRLTILNNDQCRLTGTSLRQSLQPDQGDNTNGPQYFILLVLLDLLPGIFLNLFLDIF